MRYPVLAAQEHALGIDRLNAVPRVGLRDEDRIVVRRHDAGVVVEHVDPAVAPCRLRVHALHARRVAHVGLVEEALAAFRRRLLAGLATDVRDANLRALRREQDRGLAPDAARGARDDGDLAVEPAHQASVLRYTFLTSE